MLLTKKIGIGMNINKTKDITLMQTAQKVILDTLKDEPTLRRENESYVYEVSPIPGDRLSFAEIQQINASINPTEKLFFLIGGKYFDAISAAEQGLYQYCLGKIQNEIPGAAHADIMDVLSQIVHVDPPVQFYMEQVCSAGEQK